MAGEVKTRFKMNSYAMLHQQNINKSKILLDVNKLAIFSIKSFKETLENSNNEVNNSTNEKKSN